MRDDTYLKFVRCFPCAACRMARASDAHHTERPGTAVKGSDYSCVPLCGEHHTHGVHGVPEKEFWTGINVEGLKRYLLGVYNRIDKSIVADWREWGHPALDGTKAMKVPVKADGSGIDWRKVPGVKTQVQGIYKASAGKWVDIEVREHKTRRSLPQNSMWRAVVRQAHQHWTEQGNDFSYEVAVDYVKDQDVVWGALPTVPVKLPSGETRQVRSTKALDKAQCSNLIEATGAWLYADHGLAVLGES